MRARSRVVSFLVVAVLLVQAGGCAGGRTQSGVIARTDLDGSWKPRKLGLLYAQLAPDSMPDREAGSGARPFMGGEINAVVHVALRTRLEALAKPELRDCSAPGPARERMALLTTVILREYWLNGTLPARPVNELGRVSGCDVVLLVSVIKFGPSTTPLTVRNLGGEIRPAAPPPGQGGGRWLNCGLKLAVVKVASASPVWEAAYLESVPADGTTQEAVAASCADKLLSEFPFKR